MAAAVAAGVVLQVGTAPAAPGVLSLDRLRLGSASGPENYLYTAGNTVYPEGGVDNGTFYRFVVTTPGGAIRNSPVCRAASDFPTMDNTYTLAGSDPASTSTAWRYTLEQYTASGCTGSPTKTASQSFFVASASSFSDAALTTRKSAFRAAETAYVLLKGVRPGTGGWNVTWLLPSGAVACANTAGNDRPDSSQNGTLPKGGDGDLQYRPNAAGTGSTWNREANYETRPCPAFATTTQGSWKLRVQLNPTTFVVLPAFDVDTAAPPVPAMVAAPATPTSGTSATFAFSDAESGVSFVCALDGAAFGACTSPHTYSALAAGGHRFEVKARDSAGNESAVAVHTWLVDTTPPAPPAIDTRPTDPSKSAAASFAFSGSEPGVSFRCALDGAALAGCTSPVGYSGLSDGAHAFVVRAVDAAGNESSASAYSWTIDTTPPLAPSIETYPADPSASRDASFTFTAEPGATVSCELDSAGFAQCTSPANYSGLVEGAHSFRVKARDAAGNESPPASYAWVIGSAPAVTLATPRHGSSTNDPTPMFDGIASTDPGDAAVVTVEVYAGTTPTGVPVRTLVALRDALGIYAVVPAAALTDGTYTARAVQTDVGGQTGYSTANTFVVDTTAPAPPTLDSHPQDPSTSTGATFTFSAEAGASFDCRLDTAVFAACASPQSYGELADGVHRFEAKAVDSAGNESTAASYSWLVDANRPGVPSIDSHPQDPSTSTGATFAFSGEVGATFRCRLDGAAFASCTTPKTYAGLAEGVHRFDVKAVDTSGNESGVASFSWLVDTGPPAAPAIDSAPRDPSPSAGATFAFSSAEAGISFRCRLDGSPFAACVSPATYSGLAEGPHAFDVRAVDAAGNESLSASRSWTIDATPPHAAIDSAPADVTSSTSALLGFSADEPGASFSCRLDGGGFVSCTSPATYSGLTDGGHTFSVRARDAAGNESATTSHTWTVDSTAPLVTLSAPADASATNDPTPAFSGQAGTATGDATVVAVDLYAGGSAGGTPVRTLFTPVTAGTYSIDASPALADGVYTAVAEQTDAAGNVGRSVPATFTLDTASPLVTLAEPAAGVTVDTSMPTFSGGAGTAAGDDALVTVRVYTGSTATGTPVQRLEATRSNGTWSVKSVAPLADGTYTARASQVDAAGNLAESEPYTFTVVAAQPPATYRSEVLADAPSAFWRLGEQTGTVAADETTNQLTATYLNGVALGRTGVVSSDANTSISLDGVNDTVQVPNAARLNSSGALSLELWVNFSALPASSASLMRKEGQYLLRLTSNASIVFRIWRLGSLAELTSASGSVTANAWHHVVATWDGATMRLYVDGTAHGSRTLAAPADVTTNDLYLGSSYNSYDRYGGRLDEVAVYGAALPESRVRAHYTTANPSGDAGPNVFLPAPANGSQTNATPSFGGYGGRAAGDAAAVTVKVYAGATPSGSPVQSLTAPLSTAGTFSVKAAALASGTYTAVAEQLDGAGRVGRSPPTTFVVNAEADPVLLAAGDISACDSTGDEATASVLDRLPGIVVPVGDTVYDKGTTQEFAECYDTTWGRHKARTRPVVGDHEYGTAGAAPYFAYFGPVAGDPSKGYYSYDVGSWHVVVTNNTCGAVGGCGAGSPQEQWLRADLAASSARCTVAFLHMPRFSSGAVHGSNPGMDSLWRALYQHGVELVVSGDEHIYERYAPQTPDGVADPAAGIRLIIAGTGGRSHYAVGTIKANSEVRNGDTYGILKLTLRADAYAWQFVPEAGRVFTDSGTGTCH